MAKCQVLLQLLGTDLTRSDRVVKKRQTDGNTQSGIGRTGLSDGEPQPLGAQCVSYMCATERQGCCLQLNQDMGLLQMDKGAGVSQTAEQEADLVGAVFRL